MSWKFDTAQLLKTHQLNKEVAQLAVRIKFDSSHNVIHPTFVLATRSGNKLGAINATNISVSDSFNSNF